MNRDGMRSALGWDVTRGVNVWRDDDEGRKPPHTTTATAENEQQM